MELREYLDILRKNWVIVLLLTIIGLGVGTGYSLLAKPEYESQTQIYVSVRSDSGDAWELLRGADYSSQVISSYVELVSSDTVLEPVVAGLGLDITGTQLATYVQASTVEGATLIDIHATSSSAEQAAEIAHAVGESLKEVVWAQLEPESETGAGLVTLATTQEALVPESPTSPNLIVNSTLGFVLGLASGYGVALLRRVKDTRVRYIRELEEITDIPVIGRIVDDSSFGAQQLVVHSQPQSPQAESFRVLRTNLQHLNRGLKNHSYVITSPNQGEGESITAMNLAVVLSQADLRVLLVDSDLQAPVVTEYFGLESDTGLTDVLLGEADLGDAVRRWGETELYVLPAGRLPFTPGGLLGSEEMKKTLETLHGQYDYVILDAPSVHTLTEATVLGELASGVLLVVAAGSTTRKKVESALSGLETAGNAVLGLVVTHLSHEGSSGYHNGYTAQSQQENDPKQQGFRGVHAK